MIDIIVKVWMIQRIVAEVKPFLISLDILIDICFWWDPITERILKIDTIIILYFWIILNYLYLWREVSFLGTFSLWNHNETHTWWVCWYQEHTSQCIWRRKNIWILLNFKELKLKYLGLSSFTTVFLSCIAAKDSLYTMCWRYWGFATNFLAFFSVLTRRTSLCLRTSSHVFPISVWII